MGQLIDEVAQYLQTNGIGTLGTNLFESLMPPEANQAVCVIETTGMKPDIEIPLRDPSFQILIRDIEFDKGRTVADNIRLLLHNFYNSPFVAGGIYVYRCNLVSEGGHIGMDIEGRDMFSLNFNCRTRQPSDGT